MKISVKAKTNAKTEKVERVTQPKLPLSNNENECTLYKVEVKEPPIGGKANEAIIKALAKYFKIPPSSVRLVRGQSSKHKFFEIE